MKLEESMSGEPMAFMFIKKISETLKFRYGKNKLVTPEICFLSHLLTMRTKLGTKSYQKIKKEIPNYEKKCILFCFRLDKTHHISLTEFRLINWMVTKERVH